MQLGFRVAGRGWCSPKPVALCCPDPVFYTHCRIDYLRVGRHSWVSAFWDSAVTRCLLPASNVVEALSMLKIFRKLSWDATVIEQWLCCARRTVIMVVHTPMHRAPMSPGFQVSTYSRNVQLPVYVHLKNPEMTSLATVASRAEFCQRVAQTLHQAAMRWWVIWKTRDAGWPSQTGSCLLVLYHRCMHNSSAG